MNSVAPSPGILAERSPRDRNSKVCSGPVAPGPKPEGVAPSPARPSGSALAIGGQLPSDALAYHQRNTRSMLAALAAKSDEQDRRIAALEAAASGRRRAAAPDCDPGEAAAANWREGMLALAGLISAISCADGCPFWVGATP